jgi:hypothetical protein
MEGYCTLGDVQRALKKADLSGALRQEPRIAVDKIAAQTEPLEKRLKRYWYAPADADIVSEAEELTIPTSPASRDDEHDIPRHGGLVHGDSEVDRARYQANTDALLEAGPRYERRRRRDWSQQKREIRLATGELHDDEDGPAYTRIRLDRRDATSIDSLLVLGSDGSYTDWASSTDYSGGVGLQYRGEDYWVRVNNGGWSELYLDVHALDDDLPSLSNAVYIEDWSYGHEGIPQNVRMAVAYRAAADLVEEPAFSIPENARIRSVESKAEELREQADELLEVYE